MTNVHDVFYPSETRLHSLVIGGEYFVSDGRFLSSRTIKLSINCARRNTSMG